MATLHDGGTDTNIVYIKGAVEQILAKCVDALDTDGSSRTIAS